MWWCVLRGHTTLVDTLLFYTVNRGILFTVAQLGRMIAYLSAPETLVWYVFALTYTSSLLS